MAHADDLELARLAAGDEVAADVAAHVAECAACRAGLAEWRRTIAAPSPEDLPAPSVWTAIASQLDLDDPTDPLATSRSAGSRHPSAAPQRRGTRRAWLLAACAVVLAAGGVALGFWLAQLNQGARATDVAVAELEPFPGWSETGTATLEVDRNGDRVLVVDLPGSVPDGQLREVWLMRSDLSGLVSLGLLAGSDGRFSVPSGIDLEQFDVVDVSAEPADGNPAHSGDSIVRGTLRTV